MKVAITFIGTNRYLDYLPKYYENIEKYFLPNTEKVILAFTDGELNDVPRNLKVYKQEHLEWPNITLKLIERGFNEEQLKKILGLNYLRVFKEVVG